jgi:hypothetical protein
MAEGCDTGSARLSLGPSHAWHHSLLDRVPLLAGLWEVFNGSDRDT